MPATATAQQKRTQRPRRRLLQQRQRIRAQQQRRRAQQQRSRVRLQQPFSFTVVLVATIVTFSALWLVFPCSVGGEG